MSEKKKKYDYCDDSNMEEQVKLEKRFSDYIRIDTVSDYIKEINRLHEEREKKEKTEFITVFRGECKKYFTSGMPGIFREDVYKKNPFYERNLLYELSSNRICKGGFLEAAFEAQHDEYPSRLLDVTYNALVALYFAVTPYYKKHKSEDELDKEEGVVYIYYVRNIYSASSESINKAFDAIINKDEESFVFEEAFQKNHKFIDHMKVNQRIAIQQGAFILFQGDEYIEIPERKYDVIAIKNKAYIRKELNDLFGINTGFIYPEPYNLVSSISKKAQIAKNVQFTLKNEIKLFMTNLRDDIEYFFEKNSMNTDAISEVYKFEKNLKENKELLENVIKNCDKYVEEDVLKITQHIKSEFNKNVELFDINVKAYFSGQNIESSVSMLRME